MQASRSRERWRRDIGMTPGAHLSWVWGEYALHAQGVCDAESDEGGLAMAEFDNDMTPSEDTDDSQHAEGSSRRSFLKAAVVGSAAAVAVTGVGAATLTLTGRHTGLTRFVVLTDTISGVTADACTTDSSDSVKDSFHDSIYFWAKFNHVPKGTYTIDVTPALPTSLVDYQGSGNNVFIYNYPGGDSSFTCNPKTLPNTDDALKKKHYLPVTFTTPSDGDVLLELHLFPAGTGSVTLTAHLYEGTTTSGTEVDSASHPFTVS